MSAIDQFAETLNFYISDAENGISRVPRQKLVEIQKELRRLAALAPQQAAPMPEVTARMLPAVEVHDVDTLPSCGLLVAIANVHEGCVIALQGTNGKMIGWIDTHAWTKGRVYRDQLLPPSEAGTSEREPVAWARQTLSARLDISGSSLVFWKQDVVEGYTMPLYTHPAPAQAPVDGEAVRALREAEQAFEAIRILLVKDLDEPGRTAFWRAVGARDAIRTALAAPSAQKEP